jgi:class 3 adenylate cyclase/cytoskeletal protein RodZ
MDPEPSSERLERKLATIVSADVAGYSRLMGENEEPATEVLRGHRRVYEQLLAMHRGRLFNTAGDALLSEFASAVEAVRFATELQSAIRTRNEQLPEALRMQFRIGINLGDVIVQDGDLLGDGVNVAARVQTLAEPGGICLSASVHDQIQNKLTLAFKDLGAQSYKNIPRPIRTYSIASSDAGTLPTPELPRPSRARRTAGLARFLPLAAVVGMVVLAAGGLIVWQGIRVERAAQADLARERKVAEEARARAEAAAREAELAAARRATEDARQRAEVAERQAADEERRRVEAERQRAEAERLAARGTTVPPALPQPATSPATTVAPGVALAPSGTAVPEKPPATNPYDGRWTGTVSCDHQRDASLSFQRSARIVLREGKGETQFGQPGAAGSTHMEMRVVGEAVTIALSGLGRGGEPFAAEVRGQVRDGQIEARGRSGPRGLLACTWRYTKG